MTHQLKKGKKYKDNYGKVWEVLYNEQNKEFLLWNDETCWGHWDSGKGLKELEVDESNHHD